MVEVLQAAQKRIDKTARKHGGLSPWLRAHGSLNMQFAKQDYAWIDINVHTKLQQFLHLVSSSGMSALPAKSGLPPRPEFHLSIRTSCWTKLRRADASDGAWQPPLGHGVRAHSTGV